jgi:uncharacterized protein (TIGR03382 family)
MKDGEFDRLRIPLADPEDADDPEFDEFSERTGVGASPAQLATGSAILAGLILLGVAALRRRRRSGPDGAGGSG